MVSNGETIGVRDVAAGIGQLDQREDRGGTVSTGDAGVQHGCVADLNDESLHFAHRMDAIHVMLGAILFQGYQGHEAHAGRSALGRVRSQAE